MREIPRHIQTHGKAPLRETSGAPATMTRRHVIELFGALGLAAMASPLASSVVRAQSTPGASVVPGPQPDGTNLWRVQVGGMDMASGTDMHAFFPGEITINAGDSIEFAFAPMGMPGFHTVTFTSGDDIPPIFIPDTDEGTAATAMAGPPRILVNPALAWPDGRTDYDGTGMVNSGLDVLRSEDQGPYILTFTTPGSYEYVCGVHFIVMKGSVTVQEAGSDLPYDQAGYDEMASGEMAALLETGMAAIAEAEGKAATPSAEGPWEVAVGVGGMSQARVMRFIPPELTIKVGDTVRWTNMSDGEPHTVTFLGGAEQPEDVLIEPQDAGVPKLYQNTQSLLPAGGPEFDGTGFTSSGFLGMPPEVNEMFGLVGQSWELTFSAAGDYPYYCILHSGGPETEGGMNGRIIVEE